MGSVISIIRVALQLLPLIVEAIRAIEAAMPEGGNGQAKMEVLKTTIEAAMTTATEVEHTFGEVWPTISAMASSVVTAFNLGGIFKHKQ